MGYFQPSWIERDGAAAVFAIQAGVVGLAIVLFITPVIWMGRVAAQRKRIEDAIGEGAVRFYR